MMTGIITNLRPRIELSVRGTGSHGIFEFTIDTGYEGTLTLPESICAVLHLIKDRESRFRLADGSEINLSVYLLFVEWDSRERRVEILALGEEPLLGATMLDGYELCLNYKTNRLTIAEV